MKIIKIIKPINKCPTLRTSEGQNVHQNVRSPECNAPIGAAVREDAPKAPVKEGELAAEALGVADATHDAHGEPDDSMPERELLELPTSATARVEALRHQVRS